MLMSYGWVAPGLNSQLVNSRPESWSFTSYPWYSTLQTTNPLIAWPLSEKSQLCMVTSCACFWPRHSPYSNYLCRASDIAAVGTIFNVFSYDVVSARDSNLSPSRRRADAPRVEPRSQVMKMTNISYFNIFWGLEFFLETIVVTSFVIKSILKEERKEFLFIVYFYIKYKITVILVLLYFKTVSGNKVHKTECYFWGP